MLSGDLRTRTLIVTELLIAALSLAAGVVTWWLLLLAPTILIAVVLSVRGLVWPSALHSRVVCWLLHLASAVNGLFVVAAVFVYFAHGSVPERHIVHDDFTGWVLIVHDIPNGDAVPQRDGALVYQIPKSGILVTRENGNLGWYAPETHQVLTRSGLPLDIRRPQGGSYSGGHCKFKYRRYWIGPGDIDYSDDITGRAAATVCAMEGAPP